MYELVPEIVLAIIVFGTMAVPIIVMTMASLYFWLREMLTGVPEDETPTLPELLRRHKIGDKDG